MMILDESLFESINSNIEYESISDIDKFKKYADEILGGYGGMSDSDIKRDIEEIYIDGELKGYIGLSKYNEEDGAKLLGIGNFMIIERGKGYGTQVINDIVSKYKNEYDLIYCFVDSDNEGAISLYKKLGKVYDEDGPNDNDQYYVTFYDNGKYELEESLTEDLNSMLPYYNNLQDEDRTYILSFLSKDPTWNEKKESGQYSKWILDKLNRKIIDNSILGHLGDLLKRFEDNKKQLKDKDIMKFKSVIDLEDYLNNDNNYINLSHRQEVRQRQKDRHNVDLNNEAELVYEDNDWEVWVPETYVASCKLGQGTSWCTASTETSDYFDDYNDDGPLYININKHNPKEKYQFHFESKSFMDKNDEEINIEAFFIDNPILYKKVYNNRYDFNIDDALWELSKLEKNNYTYYYDGYEISDYIKNKIKKVIIANNVTNINLGAFYNCTSLTSVIIPNSVTSIGESAFSYCTSLTNIEIPDSVTSIGGGAFVDCHSLTSVNYTGTIDSWAEIEFNNSTSNPLYYAKNLYINGELVTQANITTATKINSYAFYNCRSLISIEIPNSVTSIGNYAFSYCNNLTIYCEAESQPDGWDSDWNKQNRPVIWGYKGNKTNESFQKSMNAKYKLEEAKKKKRKKKKNKLSLKGFGWWPIYMDDEDRNCGNMEYNNTMFNKMMGSADYSSDVGGDIGASDAGAGEGAGIGMGESLIKETSIKMMPRVKEFILTYPNLIQDEDWDELFDAHACNPDWPELDEDEVRNLVDILNDTCNADLDVEGILAGV